MIADLPPELGPDWLVLALPRGGVPIGAVLARHLGAPLDVLVVRKVGVPGQPELALAAVTGTEEADLTGNETVRRALGLSNERVQELARELAADVENRRARLTSGRPAPELKDRKILVVDDGAATGTTLAAAVDALQRAGAAKIMVALPVALHGSLGRIAGKVDQVICPMPDAPFHAVSLVYQDFPQVSDDTVIKLLEHQPLSNAL